MGDDDLDKFDFRTVGESQVNGKRSNVLLSRPLLKKDEGFIFRNGQSNWTYPA